MDKFEQIILDRKLTPFLAKFEQLKNTKCLNWRKELAKATNLRELQDEFEQYGCRECLEIRGILQLQGENTNEIIVKISLKVGVVIKEEDISISHCLPVQGRNANNFNPAIFCKIYETSHTQYKLKDLATRDMGYSRSTPSKIFIVECLTKRKKELFKVCLQAKRDKGCCFLWTLYGKIMMRKDESSEAVTISSLQQLDGIS
ncbi:Hypothetical predicted protein [Paramuricea clavata]|uniref:FP protein C-terminal domain-containing protein n=1 Tax=Paramuricea clavata TaxID=317549 RepID=A0A6S7IXQ9_PARCT|nr:Hypothetical predicted protein [Paramuricea clavata]